MFYESKACLCLPVINRHQESRTTYLGIDAYLCFCIWLRKVIKYWMEKKYVSIHMEILSSYGIIIVSEGFPGSSTSGMISHMT